MYIYIYLQEGTSFSFDSYLSLDLFSLIFIYAFYIIFNIYYISLNNSL